MLAALAMVPLLGAAAPAPEAAPTLTPAQLAAKVARRAAQDAAWRAEAKKLVAAPALAAVAPRVVEHGSRDEKLIALTFDACSTRDIAQYDERITKTLVDTGTPATIFLGGHWALEEAAHVKYLASLPQFELANHTYSHPHMKRLSDQAMQQELRETQAAIFGLTGRQPTLFRPPYGEYDARVLKNAAAVGLTTIEYDVASGDPDEHATAKRLVRWIEYKAKGGSVVVMHLNHLKFHTAEALPGVIETLKKKGFSFVTVSELLKRAPPAPAPAVSVAKAVVHRPVVR